VSGVAKPQPWHTEGPWQCVALLTHHCVAHAHVQHSLGDEYAMLVPCSTAAGAASVRVAVQKAAALAGEAEFSYAINAARRAEKRRIHAFVRLLDYIICSALHALLVGSIGDMLAAFTPAGSPKQLTSAADNQASGGPTTPEPGTRQAADGRQQTGLLC
jgi:hypothetical protein